MFPQCVHGRQALYWNQYGFLSDILSAGRHKFGCSTIRFQMFSVNLMTRGFWNSSFLYHFTKGQTTTGMNLFPNLLDAAGRPEHSLSSIDARPSLERLFHSWVCVVLIASTPNALFNTSKAPENVLPNMKQNFTETRCLWKSPILNRRKIRCASKTLVHSNRRSTMAKQTRTIRFVAFPRETHC